MTQTLAIFYDAYRSLNAKKMFWIVLILSALVAGAFACVGINERGLKLLFWQLDTEPLTTELITPAMFYKLLFKELGVDLWLTWFATILALISTAGIFPDLINSGSIHLLVSKPIGRLRLFLTQYAAGLLFVTFQVTLFSLGCFLVIGLRGKVWEPSLFVAVPVVVCFFSYLFSVCVLLGLVTHSTLAALLLTLLFWPFTAGVGLTENWLLLARKQEEHGSFAPGAVQVERLDTHSAPRRPADNRPPGSSPPAETDSGSDDDAAGRKRGGKVARAIGRSLLKALAQPSAEDNKKGPKETKETLRVPSTSNSATNRPDDGKSGSDKLKLAHDILYAAKTILPKTTETIGLLERSLYDMADLPPGALGQPPESQKAQRELLETLRERSVWWIVGTSLGFEAFVLCLAAFVFCRRDY